ncbi:hypothetical protein RB195_020441 [Necator americanus]|uniref:Uncharacterized protein n=1 Tax=Necator americanus TaxID=51031 RepID=A0ABR1CLM3_NECAM
MLTCRGALYFGILLFVIPLCFGQDPVGAYNFGIKPHGKTSATYPPEYGKWSDNEKDTQGAITRTVRDAGNEPRSRAKRWYGYGMPWGYGYGGWGVPWGGYMRPWRLGGFGYPYGMGMGFPYPYGMGLGYGLGGMGLYG